MLMLAAMVLVPAAVAPAASSANLEEVQLVPEVESWHPPAAVTAGHPSAAVSATEVLEMEEKKLWQLRILPKLLRCKPVVLPWS